LAGGMSRLAALWVASLLIAGLMSIETAQVSLAAAKLWVVSYFDWLFVGVANLAIVGVLFVALHPAGKLRLGAADARPEFGRLAWFAMLFSAGLASGLLYWATAEPIIHLQANPWLSEASSSADAVATALRITVMHWGLHGWAFYVLAGLAISIYAYRHERPLSFRSGFYPVLGEKWIDRWPGKGIDLLALLGTVCGVATSIGLSAGSMNATLASLFSIDVGTANQIVIVFAVCSLGIMSALSGLSRGIRRLSEVNVWVSGLLLVSFVALGPTAYLAKLLVQTLGDYVVHAIPSGLWLGEGIEDRGWQADWTIFYWGWWLAWTPFVSLFIARISKGRTIREFALAVLVVPTLVTLVWMVVLGGTAIHQEAVQPGSVTQVVNQDYSLGLVTVLEGLVPAPMSTALVAITAFLLFTWLITSLDSATLVICHLLGVEELPAAKIFWGLVLAGVAALLLRVGGLHALQAASIVIGLPLALLVGVLGLGLLCEFARGRV
jgi:choline/glycine/proline betaine transport protein